MPPQEFVDSARAAIIARVISTALYDLTHNQKEKGIRTLENLCAAARKGQLESFLIASLLPPIPPSVEQLQKKPGALTAALRDFVCVECKGDFDTFVSAVVALGWFESFNSWQSWEDIPQADVERAYKARTFIADTIKVMQAQQEPLDEFERHPVK